VVVAPPDKSLEQDLIGWIAACLLAGLMLPLLAMLYLDVLETKNEAKQSIEKVEKLRRQVEQQRKGTKDE
jgi:di/tricarboxylate transporter